MAFFNKEAQHLDEVRGLVSDVIKMPVCRCISSYKSRSPRQQRDSTNDRVRSWALLSSNFRVLISILSEKFSMADAVPEIPFAAQGELRVYFSTRPDWSLPVILFSAAMAVSRSPGAVLSSKTRLSNCSSVAMQITFESKPYGKLSAQCAGRAELVTQPPVVQVEHVV